VSDRRPFEGGRSAAAGEDGWVRFANPRLREHGAAGAARTGAKSGVRESAPPRLNMTWVRCYEAGTESEAHVVRGFLEERGVPCLLRPMGSSIYPMAAFGTQVLVPSDWQPVATNWLRGRRRPSRRVLRLPQRRKRA